MEKTFIQSSWTNIDESYEQPLRPQRLEDFIGQERIQKRLQISVGAALQRKEPLGHILFSGPPGLGKTTLANILAHQMNANITITSGPVLEKPADLAGILTNLQKNDILFIDEIHRLPKQIEEYLYAAMEDFILDLLIDSGPNARSVQIKLNPFTLVGATTRFGLLSSPLRSRFLIQARLDYYPIEALAVIVKRSAQILHIDIDEDATTHIAQRCRGTPRIANNLLRWIRDFAQMHQQKTISNPLANEALNLLGIDQKGLDELDKKILNVIIDHYNGGPVGIKTISVALGEEPDTLTEVHEPFLIRHGFLKRTPRGREATALAYSHMNRKSLPNNHGDMS
ncbi:MAG: Holliday junction branch migration DNA helicase RuvB [Parachlamydiales bacterium]|nr:Holliday junction branch migration DNA helicase RuvB [Parachlamydiales bacterium]